MDKTISRRMLAAYTDQELVRELQLFDQDPITERLLAIAEKLVAWEALGPDPDDVSDMLSSHEHEVNDLELTIAELQRDVDRLQTMTVVDLIKNLGEENYRLETENGRARRDAEVARQERDKMSSKLDMWAIMNR